MKIQRLIEELEKIKERHGDIECVVEMTNFYGDLIDSTVETLEVTRRKDGSAAVRIDWRC